MQVFDYSNTATAMAQPKVIDYGHKPSAAIASNLSSDIDGRNNLTACHPSPTGVVNHDKDDCLKSGKMTYEYEHTKSNQNIKYIILQRERQQHQQQQRPMISEYGGDLNSSISPSLSSLTNQSTIPGMFVQGMGLSKNAIKKRNRKRKQQERLQQYQKQHQEQQQEQQPTEKKPTLLPTIISTTPCNNKTAAATTVVDGTHATSTNINNNNSQNKKQPTNTHVEPELIKADDLEDISDSEDMIVEETLSSSSSPPPPPPPVFPKSQNNKHSTKFTSTSKANENLIKLDATHLQMSIPTMENCNTIIIDDILRPPGRQTRPKKICIILRGPPGSGKSYVAKLIKEKEADMGGANPRILSIDDYFLIENDYVEKCPKTGKQIPKKEILYEYDETMEDVYMQYLIKSFKKTIADDLYDFIIIDCNNNSLRTLNEFYCFAKDSGYMPYIIDLLCDAETCYGRNLHQRSERDIKAIINNWCETPFHYIKLDVSALLENVVEMEDVENMATDQVNSNNNSEESTLESLPKPDGIPSDSNTIDGGEENESINCAEDDTANCGFLKSKWERENTTENLARLDGTNKLLLHKRNASSMADYLQLDDWQPRATRANGKKRVRWADIEEKRKQEKMRAIGFVVGQTDWKRMMDPTAGSRALNRTKYIERVNKRRF